MVDVLYNHNPSGYTADISWLLADVVIASYIHGFMNDEGFTSQIKDFARYAIEILRESTHVTWYKIVDFFKQESFYRSHMAAAETTIFDTMTWKQKLGYLASAHEAKSQAAAWYPANTLFNGLGDAFRHAYWSSLCVKRIGESLTSSLTDAHETNYDPATYEYYWKDRDMDLFNNTVGRGYASTSYIILPANSKFALEAGELRYLSPLGAFVNSAYNDDAANAQSALIPTNQ